VLDGLMKLQEKIQAQHSGKPFPPAQMYHAGQSFAV